MAERPRITDQFDPEQIYQIIEEYLSVVGRRQYIGARYVPIFGRVGEDSIEWDNTAPYEPLTIVLYEGNSFTSRQYVPTGVDINNEDFWACTGNYNAQVEAYRREVLQYAADVEANNRRVDAIENALPAEAFDDQTVKDYIDDRTVEVPSTYQVHEKDIEKVGELVNLGIVQGMHFDGEHFYSATYQDTESHTRIVKYDAGFNEVGRLELDEYAHCNCLSEFNGYMYATGASKLKKINLSTFTAAEDVPLQNTLDDFVVFANGTYAFAYRNTSTPPAIYGYEHDKFVPVGVFDYETGLPGRQDACQCFNNVCHLMGNVNPSSNGKITNQLVFIRRNGAICFRIVLPEFENELQGVTYIEAENTFYICDVVGNVYSLVMGSWFNSGLTNFSVDNVWLMYRTLEYSNMIGSYEQQPDVFEHFESTSGQTIDLVRFFNHRFPYLRNAENVFMRVHNQWMQGTISESSSGYDTIRATLPVYWASRAIYVIQMNYDRGTNHSLYLSRLAITKITQNGITNAAAISFTESETSESFQAKVIEYVNNADLSGNPLLSAGTFGLCCFGRPLPGVYNTFIDLG